MALLPSLYRFFFARLSRLYKTALHDGRATDLRSAIALHDGQGGGGVRGAGRITAKRRDRVSETL